MRRDIPDAFRQKPRKKMTREVSQALDSLLKQGAEKWAIQFPQRFRSAIIDRPQKTK